MRFQFTQVENPKGTQNNTRNSKSPNWVCLPSFKIGFISMVQYLLKSKYDSTEYIFFGKQSCDKLIQVEAMKMVGSKQTTCIPCLLAQSFLPILCCICFLNLNSTLCTQEETYDGSKVYNLRRSILIWAQSCWQRPTVRERQKCRCSAYPNSYL